MKFKFKVWQLILGTMLFWGLVIGNYCIYKAQSITGRTSWTRVGVGIGVISDIILFTILLTEIILSKWWNTEIHLDKFDKE